jgi:hypothetical protein
LNADYYSILYWGLIKTYEHISIYRAASYRAYTGMGADWKHHGEYTEDRGYPPGKGKNTQAQGL